MQSLTEHLNNSLESQVTQVEESTINEATVKVRKGTVCDEIGSSDPLGDAEDIGIGLISVIGKGAAAKKDREAIAKLLGCQGDEEKTWGYAEIIAFAGNEIYGWVDCERDYENEKDEEEWQQVFKRGLANEYGDPKYLETIWYDHSLEEQWDRYSGWDSSHRTNGSMERLGEEAVHTMSQEVVKNWNAISNIIFGKDWC